MAVIVKYIVVRNGVEKMTFATKKEADAHDKMLDIADNLLDFFKTEKLNIDDMQMEDVSLFLAENRDKIAPILRGVFPKSAKPSSTTGKPASAGETKPNAPKAAARKKAPAKAAAKTEPKA